MKIIALLTLFFSLAASAEPLVADTVGPMHFKTIPVPKVHHVPRPTHHRAKLQFTRAPRHVSFVLMDKNQILKEMREPGHKKKAHTVTQPLDQVLPPAKRRKLDRKKSQRLHPVSWLDQIFPSAYAMGCKPKADPAPVPTIPATTVVATPSSSPTGYPVVAPVGPPSPSPTPSASPSVAAPTGVDLRSRDASIKSQIGPYCTAYGLAAAIENKLGDHQDLSERHVWSFYQQYSVDAAAASVPGHLITPEAFWPEANKNPYPGYLPAAKHELVTINELEDGSGAVAALNRGNPVYIGIAVPQDMADCRATIRPATSITKNGHAVEIAGYELTPGTGGGGYWIIKQSWGTDCGDSGYQYMPWSVCDLDGMYCDFFDVAAVQ